MKKNSKPTKKQIDGALDYALKKIGPISPWFDVEVNAWVFSHEAFPDVEYAGEDPGEVIENYPHYLRDFIIHYLDGTLHPALAKKVSFPKK